MPPPSNTKHRDGVFDNTMNPILSREDIVVIRLARQGLSAPAIAALLNCSEHRVEAIRKRFVPRPRNIFRGPPGTGVYAHCPLCGVKAKMPCAKCAMQAMVRPTGEYEWEKEPNLNEEKQDETT